MDKAWEEVSEKHDSSQEIHYTSKIYQIPVSMTSWIEYDSSCLS